MAIRVVQRGSGSPRPLFLGYHIPSSADEALAKALGSRALIVIDERSKWADYDTVDSLDKTLAGLGPHLSPVILAGFSGGGNATRRILAQGGDPDALITADATYGSTPEGWADWARYAARARRGERVFIASHTSFLYPSATWLVLKAITGWDLPLGAGAPGTPAGTPTIGAAGFERHSAGKLVVYSYPTWDMPGHMRQATGVLPKMTTEAMGMLGPTQNQDGGSGGGGGLLAALMLGFGGAMILGKHG